jgi:hypothetical protein
MYTDPREIKNSAKNCLMNCVHASPNIIRTGSEVGNAFSINERCVFNYFRNNSGKSTRRLRLIIADIKMDLKEIPCKAVDWIHLT